MDTRALKLAVLTWTMQEIIREHEQRSRPSRDYRGGRYDQSISNAIEVLGNALFLGIEGYAVGYKQMNEEMITNKAKEVYNDIEKFATESVLANRA